MKRSLQTAIERETEDFLSKYPHTLISAFVRFLHADNV